MISGDGAGGSIPGLDVRVAGNHQFGGQWIPPEGIAVLRTGQELDRDPLTNVTTRVRHVDQSSVVIAQVGPMQSLEFTYRRTDGMLVSAVFTEALPPVPGMSKVLEFELAGTR